MNLTSTPIQIVWFKRDLRLSDHHPLLEASRTDLPTLLLFALEPSLIADPHYGERHWRFLWECATDMQLHLDKFRLKLHIVSAKMSDLLGYIAQKHAIKRVLSHQETGLDVTFQRDKHLARWCQKRGVVWEEFPTGAVRRGLRHRRDWNRHWKEIMGQPIKPIPLEKIGPLELSFPPSMQANHVLPPTVFRRNPAFQQGGRKQADLLLESFLHKRGASYNQHISKPEASRNSCSRLSPHLAWGSISLREVIQTWRDIYPDSTFKKALKSFESRLHWHCHFIQKFESECEMEFRNVNRGYDRIRTQHNEAHIQAWKTGQTGFPLVDAAMRCVTATGYLNFRLRSTLVSFLTHHLWQDWKTGIVHLGELFLDFEPGIHYCQFQMQAGTLGPNRVRIYNPVKQSLDHDPQAIFIQKWCPELRTLPAPLALAPWKLTPLEQQLYGVQLGIDYPRRIINHEETYRKANKTLWDMKKDALVQQENQRIGKRHLKRPVHRET